MAIVSKTTIAARQIRRVLPQANITKITTRVQASPGRLTDCDAVFGCLDSFDARLQLEALCRRYLIPYIDLGMDVGQCEGGFLIFGQVALSMPGKPCLQCTNVIKDEWRAREAAGYGAAGGRPQVVWPNGVLASLAVGILIQLVTPWHSDGHGSTLLEYDGNRQTVVRSTMLNHLTGCPHFESLDNVGDPWFNLTK